MDKTMDNVSIITGTIGAIFGASISNVERILGIIIMIVGIISSIIGLCGKIYSHFKKADTNNDGKVDLKEFIELIKNIDTEKTKKEIIKELNTIKEQIKELEDVNKE